MKTTKTPETLPLTISVNKDQLLALFTAAFGSFRDQPNKAPAKARPPSSHPEAVSRSTSGQIVMQHFGKLTRQRKLTTENVGNFLKRKGYAPTTAMPLLSALCRAGHISRVARGTYEINRQNRSSK